MKMNFYLKCGAHDGRFFSRETGGMNDINVPKWKHFLYFSFNLDKFRNLLCVLRSVFVLYEYINNLMLKCEINSLTDWQNTINRLKNICQSFFLFHQRFCLLFPKAVALFFSRMTAWWFLNLWFIMNTVSAETCCGFWMIRLGLDDYIWRPWFF